MKSTALLLLLFLAGCKKPSDKPSGKLPSPAAEATPASQNSPTFESELKKDVDELQTLTMKSVSALSELEKENRVLREDNDALHKTLRRYQGGSEIYGNTIVESATDVTGVRNYKYFENGKEELNIWCDSGGCKFNGKNGAELFHENEMLHKKIAMLLKSPPADYGRCFDATEPGEAKRASESKK